MNNRLWIASGLVLAAGAVYFFDPRTGARRRQMLRDRTAVTARRAARAAEQLGRRLRHRAIGEHQEPTAVPMLQATGRPHTG